jgi:hypothetical protein
VLWKRVGESGGGGHTKAAEPHEFEVSSNSSARIEVRLKVEADDQTVHWVPILRIPQVSGLQESLRDISVDLDAGRRLGAGGFIALDFETATSSRDSACAIGVAAVMNGEVPDIKSWLIRPPRNDYDGFNVAIHGITPEMTANSPSMGEVARGARMDQRSAARGALCTV